MYISIEGKGRGARRVFVLDEVSGIQYEGSKKQQSNNNNSRSTRFPMIIILEKTEEMDVPMFKLLSSSWVIHPQYEVRLASGGVLSNMSSS